MRGRYQAHIDGNAACATDTFDAALLENAQQLHLHHARHVADFIEKKGAAGRLFEATGAGRHGARKCTTFMAEKFAFEQMLRDRATIDGDERPFAARSLVDLPRDDFLAGSGLALD